MRKLNNIETQLKKGVAYEKERVFIQRAYNFTQIVKICKARDDFCDVERYRSVISAFQKTFEIQTLEYILRKKTNTPCLRVAK